ncbi:hypothetical protein TNCT_722121 [Trichonephila clavata]|uniref:Uncharacterized protein n=1 Tax=Trichonephila clavata TaxID=2740835 RepID=A0A8X6L7L8_TRICU|nr:hypothetical protein TNCT_722121 [Trichonephila clavata]
MFRSQLEENESDYGELLYHADVCWLSRSIFLQRFRDLLSEVKYFLESKDETYIELSDKVCQKSDDASKFEDQTDEQQIFSAAWIKSK